MTLKRWELLIGDKQRRIQTAIEEQQGKCSSCLDSGGGGEELAVNYWQCLAF